MMGRHRKNKQKKLAQVLPGLIQIGSYFAQDLRQQWRLVTTSFAALLFGVVFRLLEPWPLKFLLDSVFKPTESPAAATITLPETWSPTALVVFVSLAFIVIAGLRATTDYISNAGFFRVGNFVVIRIRERVYRHLQNLPMVFHDRAKHGDLITRVTRDVNMLRDVAATAILPLVGSAMVLCGMAVVMIWLNWKLAAISLVVVPIYWLTTIRLGRRIRESARKQRLREGAMATFASEAIGSIRAIKTLGLEKKFAADFSRINQQSQNDDLKSGRLSLRLGRTVDILLAISTAAVLWMGAHFVLSGKMFPGDLVVFLVYLKRSFKPAQEFAKYTARIAKATAAGERVIDLLEQPTEPAGLSEHLDLRGIRGEIEFQNVCFGYDDKQLILKDFNLKIDSGKTVAITGPSGIGKSTILGLLLRLYTLRSGRILIDGKDIQNYSPGSIRSAFGVVLQDPLLFAGTIRENIALGNPDEATDAKILAAARTAEVDEFVLQMPDLFETRIGERSATISRGQRQRIAIARAALADRPMLLLDEPTTGLDENNQSIVTDALLELARDKTTLMITHNLAMASRADEVVYISAGQVVQHGTHQELMRKPGPYATTFLQSQDGLAIGKQVAGISPGEASHE